MNSTLRVLSSAVFCALLSSFASAAMITESFSGSGDLVSPGGTGDHTSDVFTLSVTDTVGCATISFDVNVTTSTGENIHFDTRGFGDTGGSNDALQSGAEDLDFTITNLVVNATGGGTYISDTIAVSFVSLDVVNNGGAAPRINYTDDLNATAQNLLSPNGTPLTPPNNFGGTSGDIMRLLVTGSATVPDTNTYAERAVISPGATAMTADSAGAWMWINNAQFEYSGDVVVEKVPEPSGIVLLSFSLLGFGFVRKR